MANVFNTKYWQVDSNGYMSNDIVVKPVGKNKAGTITTFNGIQVITPSRLMFCNDFKVDNIDELDLKVALYPKEVLAFGFPTDIHFKTESNRAVFWDRSWKATYANGPISISEIEGRNIELMWDQAYKLTEEAECSLEHFQQEYLMIHLREYTPYTNEQIEEMFVTYEKQVMAYIDSNSFDLKEALMQVVLADRQDDLMARASQSGKYDPNYVAFPPAC